MFKATCSENGCDWSPRINGLCWRHYQRWRKLQEPDRPARKKPDRPAREKPLQPEEKPVCKVDDCGRTASAKGYCNRHYENLRKYGNPVPQRDRPLDVRLREIGWTVTESGCWEWDGKRNDNGYGLFSAKRLGFVGARAHRVVYVHFGGTLVDEDHLRHKCDNPPCVNPEHLIPGTPLDNMRDMVKRGRHWRYGRTHCDNGHDLTLPGARTTLGWCLECDRARKRRYEERKRLERASC